jgi:hypothetical protein
LPALALGRSAGTAFAVRHARLDRFHRRRWSEIVGQGARDRCGAACSAMSSTRHSRLPPVSVIVM